MTKAKNEPGSKRWSMATIVKYALFQLPEIAVLALALLLLHKWELVSAGVAFGILAAWVIKDVLLYPFVWKAYVFGGQNAVNSIVGQIGHAKDRLAPSGMVSVRGELWKARVVDGAAPIKKGQTVRVVSIDGLTLCVEPVKEKNQG